MPSRDRCPPAVLCAFAVLSLLPPPARADFRNGVEHFDGSSLDLTTWVPFHTSGTTVANAVTLNIPERSGDLTTRSLTAGVGDTVQVEIRVNAYNAPAGIVGVVGVDLTNNSGGTTTTADLDSQFLSVFSIEDNATLVSHTGSGGDAPILINHDNLWCRLPACS